MERIRFGARLGALAIACAIVLSGIDPACATGTPVPDTQGHVRPQDDLYLADFFRDPDFVHRVPAIVVDDKTPAGPPEPTRSVDDKLRAILEGAASMQQPPGTRLQLLGDFYASYTDADSIERLGVQPLEPLFARIDAIHHARDLGALFGDLGTLNVPTPIVALVERSPRDSARMQVRLASSDVGYSHLQKSGWLYPASSRLNNLTQYGAYIEQVLSESGDAQAHAHALRVLELEVQIDQIARTRPASDRQDRPFTLAELGDLAPGIAWSAWMTARGFGDAVDSVVVENPYYIHALDAVLVKTPIDSIKAYLKFKCVDVYADYLPRRIATARRASGTLSIVDPDHHARWRDGIDLVNVTLGQELGREYGERYFTSAQRERVSALVESILAAYRRAIMQAAWLDSESRTRAIARLDSIEFVIGYSTQWEDDPTLVIRRNDLFGNMTRIAARRNAQDAAMLGKRIGRSVDALMLPQSAVFRYVREDHRVLLPAAGLEELDKRSNFAYRYALLGAVIAHEISHAFAPRTTLSYPDDVHRPTWLTDAARLRYIEKMESLATQFNTNPPRPYPPLPGQYTLSSYALEEGVAYLTGLQISFNAYQFLMRGKPPELISGIAGERIFFYYFADSNFDASHEPPLRTHWPAHAPGYFNTNATVRNLNGFYDAFGVRPMDALYLPENQRISLW